MQIRNGLWFLLLAALWGSAFVAIKAGLPYFPPVLFAALRYDLAGAVMVVFALLTADRGIPVGGQQWFAVGVGGLFIFGIYHAFLFAGEIYTSSGVAAMLVGMVPILTAFFARAILGRKRLTPVVLLGLLVSLLGVGTVTRIDVSALWRGSLIGEGLILTASASIALGSVLLRRIDSNIETRTLQGWAMLLGALFMHAYSFVSPAESFTGIRWTPRAIACLLHLALIPSAVGYGIYFMLLQRLGPFEINLVSYANPVFAALYGWLLLGERLGVYAWGGFLLILAGFLLIKHRRVAREWERLRARI